MRGTRERRFFVVAGTASCITASIESGGAPAKSGAAPCNAQSGVKHTPTPW